MRAPCLIPDWRLAWRFLSVQAVALLLVWVTLPDDMQRAILAAVGVTEDRMTAALGVLVLAARLLQQPRLEAAREREGVDRS